MTTQKQHLKCPFKAGNSREFKRLVFYSTFLASRIFKHDGDFQGRRHGGCHDHRAQERRELHDRRREAVSRDGYGSHLDGSLSNSLKGHRSRSGTRTAFFEIVVDRSRLHDYHILDGTWFGYRHRDQCWRTRRNYLRIHIRRHSTMFSRCFSCRVCLKLSH